MWDQLKANHANAIRTRGEIIIIAVALVLIGVLLASFATVAQGQVRKAEMREALRQAHRVALARCWDESPTAFAMRGCAAQASLQAARALEESYGLPAGASSGLPPEATHAGIPQGLAQRQGFAQGIAGGISLVSLR